MTNLKQRKSNHKARWMHNRRFLGQLHDDFSDWMVTAVFYTAVHAVETLFAHDQTRNHTSHEARNNTLRDSRRYQQIWKYYRPLYEAALTTRYECEPERWIDADFVKTEIVPKKLYPLEKSILKLLGDRDMDCSEIQWDAR